MVDEENLTPNPPPCAGLPSTGKSTMTSTSRVATKLTKNFDVDAMWPHYFFSHVTVQQTSSHLLRLV